MSGNIQNIPLSVLLTWPTPNYDDPVRRSWMPLYAGILQAASTLTVLTRLWLRARGQAGPLGLDDVRTSKPLPQARTAILTSSQAFLLPGWLGSIVFTAFSILSTEKYGNGTHAWDVPPNLYSRLSMLGLHRSLFSSPRAAPNVRSSSSIDGSRKGRSTRSGYTAFTQHLPSRSPGALASFSRSCSHATLPRRTGSLPTHSTARNILASTRDTRILFLEP
jgi:hypothetical protein